MGEHAKRLPSHQIQRIEHDHERTRTRQPKLQLLRPLNGSHPDIPGANRAFLTADRSSDRGEHRQLLMLRKARVIYSHVESRRNSAVARQWSRRTLACHVTNTLPQGHSDSPGWFWQDLFPGGDMARGAW